MAEEKISEQPLSKENVMRNQLDVLIRRPEFLEVLFSYPFIVRLIEKKASEQKKSYHKEYYQKNKEKIKVANHKYYHDRSKSTKRKTEQRK